MRQPTSDRDTQETTDDGCDGHGATDRPGTRGVLQPGPRARGGHRLAHRPVLGAVARCRRAGDGGDAAGRGRPARTPRGLPPAARERPARTRRAGRARHRPGLRRHRHRRGRRHPRRGRQSRLPAQGRARRAAAGRGVVGAAVRHQRHRHGAGRAAAAGDPGRRTLPGGPRRPGLRGGADLRRARRDRRRAGHLRRRHPHRRPHPGPGAHGLAADRAPDDAGAGHRRRAALPRQAGGAGQPARGTAHGRRRPDRRGQPHRAGAAGAVDGRDPGPAARPLVRPGMARRWRRCLRDRAARRSAGGGAPAARRRLPGAARRDGPPDPKASRTPTPPQPARTRGSRARSRRP